MAISLKTAGTWARVVTDPSSVTIPGSPAAGDRMFLFVSWKDFAVTLADPAGWTQIDDFSDGSTAAGNGTGSVHNRVYYRNWVSGDAAPSLDWSASPTEAHAVIMLWQKAGADVWSTPAAVHAAISAATPFSATSSATITIPNNSVVMCLIGLRDDSTGMTRSTTTAISDDGSPTVTWNGNYVESPATHFNSTTGLDMSGDLGHRFVTTGASGVNLTTTGTPDAAETGTATWIVQGLAVTQDTAPALLNQAAIPTAPTVTSLATVAPALLNQAASPTAPVVTAGAVSVAPALLDRTAIATAPVVTTLATVAPALLDRTAAATAPAIASVANIAPVLLDRSAVATAPTVMPGAVDVSPALLDAAAVATAPGIASVATLGPALLDQTAVATGPSLASLAAVAPTLIDRTAVAAEPAVTTLATVAPQLLDQTAVASSPSIGGAAGDQDLAPALLDQMAVTSQPSVLAQATVAPALLVASASAIAPAITSLADITAALLDQAAYTFSPFISFPQDIGLELLTGTASALEPRVRLPIGRPAAGEIARIQRLVIALEPTAAKGGGITNLHSGGSITDV